MLKVIIIEDENKAACMLQDCIKLVATDCEVAGIAADLKNGKVLIENIKPDIAFLDVELPDGHSFDLLAELPEINFAIIFTTAHSKYAVNAFKYSAIDFVIKPITPDAIKSAIIKAKETIYTKQMSEKVANLIHNQKLNDTDKKIVIQSTDTIHYITISDIVRCQSDNNYTNIFLNNGSNIFVSKTIKEFEQLLPTTLFFRTHQSHIVNTSFISQIKKKTYQILLKNGDVIQLATRKKDELLSILKKNQ